MNSRRFLLTVIASMALAVLGLAFQASGALAAPAAPVDLPITQPDGSTFIARAWGDEWQHGMETKDGYTILLDQQSGYWVYAVAVDGALSPALSDSQQPLAVGKAAPGALEKHARPAPVANPHRMDQSSLEVEGSLLEGPARQPNLGSQPLLIIFVNFTNRTRTYALSIFESRAWGGSSSIADFYQKASFSQLSITPADEAQASTPSGMVEVTLSMAHPSNADDSRTIARNALNAANSSVNFAAFDNDGDGYVTGSELHLLFILAGYEQSYCGSSCPSPYIWGHQWQLDTPLSLDGKYVAQSSPSSAGSDYGGYTMFGEIHGLGDSNDHPATIGIMAHEMGHDLSWPDLYDTSGDTEGVGEWSIMGSASWNGLSLPGDTPGLPDAWLKWYQGWVIPAPAAAGSAYALRQANSNPDSLLLGSNPGGVDWDFTRHSGSGEYWLLENRQLSGYDAALPGCGILIWHIDESVSYNNDANADYSDPLVRLVQADNLEDLYWGTNRGDPGDPYPGTSANQEFSPTSSPPSNFYSGARSGWEVTIASSACAASMSVGVTFSSPAPLNYKVTLPVLLKTQPLPGRVTYKGAAAAGKTITLRALNTSSVWSTYATAVTDAKGNYLFIDTPSFANYTDYYVRWTNDAMQSGYLGGWFCDYITNTPQDNYVCSFDLSEAVTTSPAHGAGVYLPYTFRWNRRPIASDNYEIDFFDGVSSWWWWYNLGYVGSWTMTSLPASMNTLTWYYWGIWVYGPNGYGEPLYIYSLYFNDRSSPALLAPRGESALRLPILEEDSVLRDPRRR